ncbi:MAG: hypothetical protein AAB036_11880 [Elusimicrobiota bacterium]
MSAAPVLITAATVWEAGPLAKNLSLRPTTPSRFEGRVGARRLVLIKTGIGAVNTARSLNGDAVIGDYGLVISAGLCGAMQPDVKRGDIVADVSGVDMDIVAPLRATAQALSRPFHFGKILHTNIVLDPKSKTTLGRDHRALACDMETAAVRRWADGKIPAIGVRAVLDELDEALPSQAPEAEDIPSLARYGLTHAATLPSLMRTGWRCARAMKSLSRFLGAYLEAL